VYYLNRGRGKIMDRYKEDETVYLMYWPSINRFVDEFGCVVHDIYQYITPNQLYLFMHNENSMVLNDVTNSFIVVLSYPDYCD
jgi:hypothetical protein